MSHEERPDSTPGDPLLAERQQTKKPRMFKVILHNDDFTTMEFVVFLLRRFFHKSNPEAHELMLQVHHQGYAVPGVYSREVAETKVEQVNLVSRNSGHPFLATMEPD